MILPILAVCYGTTPILNGTAFNTTTPQGMYQYVNNACGGLVGWGLDAIFFIIIMFTASVYSNQPEVGIMVAGAVMVPGSLILQVLGLNTSYAPLLFGGLALLGVAIVVLRGILSPYK